MASAEPLSWTIDRDTQLRNQYPVLDGTAPEDVFAVDNHAASQGQAPSAFSQQALALANRAQQEYDASEPDTAPNVTGYVPPTGVNAPVAKPFDYFNPSDVVNAPIGAGENAPSAPPLETLGKVGSFLTGTLAPEGSNLVLQELLRPANYVGAGGGLAGLARGALGGIGARVGGELAQKALPADAPEWERMLAGLGGSLAGGGAGFGAVHAAESAAPQASTWMEYANRVLAESRAAEEAGSANLLQRLVSEERGSVSLPGGENPADFMAEMQAKAARGEAPTPEEHARLMNMLGEVSGALKPEDVPAAKEAYYRAPENLGGGQPITPEHQASIDRTVEMAGGRNAIEDALRAARETPETPATPDPFARFETPNPDALPEPTRTVPSNLKDIQARAQALAKRLIEEERGSVNLSGGAEPQGQQALPGFGAGEVPDVADSKLKTVAVWLGNNGIDLLSAPRSAQSALDVSGSLRQAGYLGPRHYREWADSFGKQIQSLLSGASADQIRAEVESAPLAGYRPDVLALWPKAGTGIGAREEQFASKLVQNFPGIKQTERAYETMLYTYRASVFDAFVKALDPAERTPARLDEYARYVNAATGRGNLPEFLKAYAPALNATLFSPRFAWSLPERLSYLVSRDPKIRAEAAKDALAFFGTGLTLMGTLAVAKQTGLLPGVSVNLTNIDASDWGKGKIGPITFDIWGGNQQFARAIARTAEWFGQEGERLAGVPVKPGPNPVNLWAQYFRYKASPQLNLEEWARTGGKNAIGQKVSPTEMGIRSVTPFVLQDMYDAFRAGGLGAAAGTGAASALGLGVQSTPPKPQRTGNGLPAGLPPLVLPKTAAPPALPPLKLPPIKVPSR